MTMADDDMELENLFAQARKDRPGLPDDLAVRIQTDAETTRLGRFAKNARPERSPWSRLLDNIGGWQGFSGLAAASVTGIFIGFFAPAVLPETVGLFGATDGSVLAADLGFDTSFLESTE